MKTIGVLYICTAGYTIFWEDFYQSGEQYFFKDKNNYKKEYFVFTDDENLKYKEKENVHLIYQEALKWPLITLMRYKIFNNSLSLIKNTDFLYFFNANILFNSPVNEDILPGDKDFSFLNHPWHIEHTPQNFAYERNPKSNAYIPEGKGSYYFAGGLVGGKTKPYLNMSKWIEEQTDGDFKKNIIPIWHDESYLNRFALNHMSQVKVLDVIYGIPNTWKNFMNFNPKLILRHKKDFGGHSYLRKFRKTTVSTKTKKTKYLKIGGYGIGDILYHINRFYYMAKKFNFNPVITFKPNQNRNALNNKEILDLFNIPYKTLKEVGATHREFYPIYTFLQNDYLVASNNKKGFTFMNGILKIKSRTQIPIQTELQNNIQQSELYKKIISLRKQKNNRKITLHVRRGDVARILLKPEKNKKFLTFKGIQDEKTLQTQTFRWVRFIDSQIYINKLKEIYRQEDEIILLSDGYTVFQDNYKKNPDSFSGISEKELNFLLEKELDDLKKISDRHIIGEEKEKLIPALIEGLTSDIIIAGSSNLFLQLKIWMNLDIHIIRIEND